MLSRHRHKRTARIPAEGSAEPQVERPVEQQLHVTRENRWVVNSGAKLPTVLGSNAVVSAVSDGPTLRLATVLLAGLLGRCLLACMQPLEPRQRRVEFGAGTFIPAICTVWTGCGERANASAHASAPKVVRAKAESRLRARVPGMGVQVGPK